MIIAQILAPTRVFRVSEFKGVEQVYLDHEFGFTFYVKYTARVHISVLQYVITPTMRFDMEMQHVCE